MLITNVPTYRQDSTQLLKELNQLGPLPEEAKLFTADAVSMYTSINSKDGIRVLSEFLVTYSDELPTNFPTTLFVKVLRTNCDGT